MSPMVFCVVTFLTSQDRASTRTRSPIVRCGVQSFVARVAHAGAAFFGSGALGVDDDFVDAETLAVVSSEDADEELVVLLLLLPPPAMAPRTTRPTKPMASHFRIFM